MLVDRRDTAFGREWIATFSDRYYLLGKIPFKFYEEVKTWIEKWLETCKPARVLSSA